MYLADQQERVCTVIKWPSIHASVCPSPTTPPPSSTTHVLKYTAAHAYEPDVPLGGAGLAADRGTPRSLPNSTDRRAPYGDGDGNGDGDGGH